MTQPPERTKTKEKIPENEFSQRSRSSLPEKYYTKEERSIYMKIARQYAKYSTCAKLKVGAILVDEGRIIGSGYNGTPTGFIHCKDQFPSPEDVMNGHHDWSSDNEIHAEQNCILYALKSGLRITDTCHLFVTTACCVNCAKVIIAAGIKNVVYETKYKETNGIQLLREAKVDVQEADCNPFEIKADTLDKIKIPLRDVKDIMGNEDNKKTEMLEEKAIKRFADKCHSFDMKINYEDIKKKFQEEKKPKKPKDI